MYKSKCRGHWHKKKGNYNRKGIKSDKKLIWNSLETFKSHWEYDIYLDVMKNPHVRAFSNKHAETTALGHLPGGYPPRLAPSLGERWQDR